MPKVKKAKVPVQPPEGWVIENHFTLSPQVTLYSGDKCRVKGERGVFTFKRHVVNTKFNPISEWVDVYGGSYGREQYRSLPVERIKHIPKRRTKKKSPTKKPGTSTR